MLAGGVWVYGDHLPKNPKDGNRVTFTRSQLILNDSYIQTLKDITYEPSDRTNNGKIVYLYEMYGNEYIPVPYIVIGQYQRSSTSYRDKYSYSVLVRKFATGDRNIASPTEYKNWPIRASMKNFLKTVHPAILNSSMGLFTSAYTHRGVFLSTFDDILPLQPAQLNIPGISSGKTYYAYFSNDSKRGAEREGIFSDLSEYILLDYKQGDYESENDREIYYIQGNSGIFQKNWNSLFDIRPYFVLPYDFKIIRNNTPPGTYSMYLPEEKFLDTEGLGLTLHSVQVRSPSIQWSKEKPFFARQFVYNNKGQYQTSTIDGITGLWNTTFGENSPEQIQAAIDAGVYKDIWSVGDEINIPIGSTYLTFVILGFDHDDLADGSGKAAITLGMKHLLADKYKMNEGTNVTSILDTDLYKSVILCMRSAESGWRNIMKPVIKTISKYDKSSKTVSAIQQQFNWFIPSIDEIFESHYFYTQPAIKEGKVYEYYKSTNTELREISRKNLLNGKSIPASFWTRNITNSGGFWTFDDMSVEPSSIVGNPTNSHGVNLCFCI